MSLCTRASPINRLTATSHVVEMPPEKGLRESLGAFCGVVNNSGSGYNGSLDDRAFQCHESLYCNRSRVLGLGADETGMYVLSGNKKRCVLRRG